MTTMNWLTLLGVPAIIAGSFSYFVNRVRAIKLGIQAILRDRLYNIYHDCKKRGSASPFERENFENLYKQYHRLGANGVMDDIRAKFFALAVKDDD